MITMNKAPGIPIFSHIICKDQIDPTSALAPLPSYESALVSPEMITYDYTKMGYCLYEALQQLSFIQPHIKKLQYVIMPDHLHLLLQIMEPMEHALGKYLSDFKKYVWERGRKRELISQATTCIFESGFNDQFLRRDRNLNTLFSYIRTNPYNLWIRRVRPDFFQKIQHIRICGVECSLYGNLSLLSNPFISSVVVHRSDDEKTLKQKKELWRYRVVNGGVLASAFISPQEKNIFKGAAAYGGRIILITHIPLEEREKPTGQLFHLCENGQLLIISPKIPEGKGEAHPSRGECLFMNAFAEKLSSEKPPSAVKPGLLPAAGCPRRPRVC